MKHKDVI